ncbi:hypothetical protein NDU88_007774 [Pleurodeles waltl]|uniref:Uncharacterized protein n=1 Tax=Pleurodeles waltl TaxID=8319 RepID=A0AAV7VUG1_PLEWA|nr:hypothetical protein NDU88_007774 [Pleurodeles waltl]
MNSGPHTISVLSRAEKQIYNQQRYRKDSRCQASSGRALRPFSKVYSKRIESSQQWLPQAVGLPRPASLPQRRLFFAPPPGPAQHQSKLPVPNGRKAGPCNVARRSQSSTAGTSTDFQDGSSRQPQPDLAGADPHSRPVVEPLLQQKSKRAANPANGPAAGAPKLRRAQESCLHGYSCSKSVPALRRGPQPASTHRRTGRSQQAAIGLQSTRGRPTRQSRGPTSPSPGSHKDSRSQGSRVPWSDPTVDPAPHVELPASSRRQRHNWRRRTPHQTNQPYQESLRRHVPSRPVQLGPGPPSPPRIYVCQKPVLYPPL